MNALAQDAQPEPVDDRVMKQRRVALGVDLGQSHDPTSIAVIEQIKHVIPQCSADKMLRSRRPPALSSGTV